MPEQPGLNKWERTSEILPPRFLPVLFRICGLRFTAIFADLEPRMQPIAAHLEWQHSGISKEHYGFYG